MRQPRGLDTYCKAGGATRGYQLAGAYMVGVDTEPQPNYCGEEFIQADAIEVLADQEFLAGFDFIHASPPCQRFAGTYQDHSHHPDLLTPTRELLKAIGKPYVIENIPTAPMPTGILLCGATFGLPTIRHRRFEVYPDPGLVPSLCPQRKHGRGVTHGPGFYPYARKRWEANWDRYVLPVLWPWMTRDESGQAVPPPYTEFLAKFMFAALEDEAA